MASYTLFISGLSSSTSPDVNNKLNSVSADETIIVFDSIDTYTMSLANEKTSFPIESRSQISDHVFSQDGKFSFTGYVTSAPMFIRKQVAWDKNTDPKNPKTTPRIRDAYDVIKAARDSRSAVSLSTEEFDLTNYVITGFDFSREGPSDLGTFNISLEEMRIRTIGTTVLATNVSSDIKAGKSNQNKGSTQSSKTSPPTRQELETLNRNKTTSEMFQNLFLETGKGGEFVLEGTESEKFSLEN